LETSRVPTSTLGLGEDYNEGLLSAVSAGGTGAYYFLPNAEAMTGILDRELAALERTVAQDVAISIAPGAGVVLGQPLSSGSQLDGTNLVFNMGQLSAGDARYFLVPITLPAGPLDDVVTVAATYRDALDVVSEQTLASGLQRTADAVLAEGSRDPLVTEQYERLSSALVVSAALSDFNSGNRTGAVEELREQAQRLRDSGSAGLAEEAAALDELAGELEEPEVNPRRARQLTLQNDARNTEILQGVPAPAMYHSDTVVAE
jgi:Ca-activated chloride channel family protein